MTIRNLLLAAVVALAPLAVHAQAPDPVVAEANDGVHIEIGVNYTLLNAGPGAGTSVSALKVRFPLTGRVSAGYAQFQIPAASAQVFLGGLEYREKLSHILKKAASSHVNLDNIELYAAFGAGTRRDSLGDNPTFAYGLGGGFAYRVNNNVAFGFEVGWLRAPLRHQNFVISNSPTISPGIQLRF